MVRSDEPAGLPDPRPSLEAGDPNPFRERIGSRVDEWKWLEELRFQFDLAVEVLDRDLEFVLEATPAVRRAAELRRALENRSDPTLTEITTSVLTSAKPRSFSASGLRIRVGPLLAGTHVPRPTIGLLVLADLLPPQADDPAIAEIDARLEAAGRWLSPTIGATIAGRLHDAGAARLGERAAAALDVIDHAAQLDDPAAVITLVMEAIAVWYDADVRVYRQDVSGAFLLDRCLPGVNPSDVPQRLSGPGVWARDEVFGFDAPDDFEALGWMPPANDAIFVPVLVEHVPEWLFAVLGTGADASARATLNVLRHAIGNILSGLERETAEQMRRRLGAVLSFGDAPFDASARMALEAAGQTLGAASTRLAMYADPGATPVVAVGWGVTGAPPWVEAGTASVSADVITVGTAAASGFTVVFEARSGKESFTQASARMARSAGAVFGIWMAGALVGRSDLRVRGESEYAAAFVDRLQDLLDRLGRVKVGGAMAVVLPTRAPSGPQLDELVQLVHEQVRSSDIIGIVEEGGAGVLIPEATQEVASAVVGRLLRAAQRQGLTQARVGVATFQPSSEAPESLLQRAIMNARLGPALS